MSGEDKCFLILLSFTLSGLQLLAFPSKTSYSANLELSESRVSTSLLLLKEAHVRLSFNFPFLELYKLELHSPSICWRTKTQLVIMQKAQDFIRGCSPLFLIP